MKHATRAAALALTATLVTLPSSPTVADPGPKDLRACVSIAEWRGVSLDRFTKFELEQRWEVRGLGVRESVPLDDEAAFAVTYPACGYDLDEVWVTVDYRANRKWETLWRWRAPGATIDGQPRLLSRTG